MQREMQRSRGSLHFFILLGNFSEFSYRIKTLRGMRTAAHKVNVAMRPPQAQVSQAKLFLVNTLCD